MSEIFDNISRSCGRNRGGIFSITFVPCDGIEFTYTDNLVTAMTQTKVAKTIDLDINSGSFKSDSIGERETMSIEYNESCEFTVKDDELLTSRILQSLAKGLHIAIVRYANGKNKIYGAGGSETSTGAVAPNGMLFNTSDDSGVNGSDLNGTIVTGSATSGDIPPHISNTDVDTIKAFTV